MRGKGLDFPHPRHSGMVAVVLPGPGRVGGADSQQSETDVRFILHTSIQQVWPGYPCSYPVKDYVFAERFMNFKDLFPSLKPSFDPVPLTEKIRAGLAATAGILLMGLALRFLPQAGYPLILLASSAAAAALLYAVPHSPMAQTVAAGWRQPACRNGRLDMQPAYTRPGSGRGLCRRYGNISHAPAALFASARCGDCDNHGVGGRAVSSSWLGLGCQHGDRQYHSFPVAGTYHQQSDFPAGVIRCVALSCPRCVRLRAVQASLDKRTSNGRWPRWTALLT